MTSVPTKGDDAPLDTRLIWAGLFLCVALFAKLPRIDLAVAAHYYTPGLGFIHAQDPVVRALYLWSPTVGRAIVATLAVFALISPLIARLLRGLGHATLAQRCTGPWRRLAIVAVLCGLLGPGLVVEGWFKNAMGRPRPVQVIELGGTEPFHGTFQPGADTAHHRSFVSSHAAAGFWLMSLGLTAGPVWRRRWLLIGVVTGSVIGAGRMMQGGHFLSDIIFAFYAVWVSCEIIAFCDRRWQQRHAHAQ
ncbi:MAG: phosphatase PAP2 family protein [Burkholderiales bacterium]|nr:phosphatase PAP2 family protein [Burkholderiales bacterium]